MLLVKYLLMAAGIVLFGTSAALVSYDVYLAIELERLLRRNEKSGTAEQRLIRCRDDASH